MAKASQKSLVGVEKKQLRNKSERTLTKTNVVKAEKTIFAGEMESAKEAVLAAISSLDKAASKGILPRNNAARRKSRLMKKLNQAQATAALAAEAKPAPRKRTRKKAQAES